MQWRSNIFNYMGDNSNIDNLSTHTSGTTEQVGITIASEKFRSSMDSFWFSVSSGIIINPFDFVSVENLFDTKTIGIVKELQVIPSRFSSSSKKNNDSFFPKQEHDITIAKVAIMGNTGFKADQMKDNISISMPVRSGKSVKFASAKEVIFGLGIPEMESPIPAGVIEMPNGLQVPISLSMYYLVGPDTAHVNASGISGNLKTSYLLFLLQSMYQRLRENDEVAIIIFNTREDDLLYLDQRPDYLSPRDEELFKLLELDIEAFHNVSYYLPRGKDGKPLSINIPVNSKTYSYELMDIYDRLELLFSEAYDPRYNLSSIIDYIYESWPIKTKSGKLVNNWSDLFKYTEYPQEIITHKNTLLHFLGQLQRFRKSSMFTDKRVTSTYLGNEIKQIRAGDVFVIDIAMIPTVEEQSFVIGDVMKNIDELYSVRHNLSDDDRKRELKRANYILVFIDEINRYLPKINPMRIRSAVEEQIMKTIIAGKSRNTILFSAQQFKSEVDYTLHEHTGLHVTAKLGLSELSTKPYDMIDKSTKMNIIRLNKGEVVMIQPAFRQPIKIKFPRASFKRPKR
jgi:uncharacterized protein